MLKEGPAFTRHPYLPDVWIGLGKDPCDCLIVGY